MYLRRGRFYVRRGRFYVRLFAIYLRPIYANLRYIDICLRFIRDIYARLQFNYAPHLCKFMLFTPGRVYLRYVYTLVCNLFTPRIYANLCYLRPFTIYLRLFYVICARLRLICVMYARLLFIYVIYARLRFIYVIYVVYDLLLFLLF